MATATLNECAQLDSSLLERVNYFPRQLLTAADMTAEQEYFLAKLRRHNRYLHGWGVVCGLEVSAAPVDDSPWRVQIGSGYALGPYGDEIYVPHTIPLDLARCGPGAATDPCDPGSLVTEGSAKTGATLYIAIRYEECLSTPVRVLPGGCGCSDSSCEPSRIDDSFEIECLADLPPSSQPAPQGVTLCDILKGAPLRCPPCPADPWVVLAQVKLPSSLRTAIAQAAIDPTIRRFIFSTAMIQEQVRLCCCAGADRVPARVTSINPAPGTEFEDASTVPGAIQVTFSKHLVESTVNTNTVLVRRIVKGQTSTVEGTVTYDDGIRAAQFLPDSAAAFTIPGTYLVTVVGSGPRHVIDADNLALDGNDDGVPGGNFISQFTVSAQPTPTPTPGPTPPPQPAAIDVAVKGPVPPPDIRSTNPSAVGDLTLTISGGVAGQSITATVTVTFSGPPPSPPLHIGAGEGSAAWDDGVNPTKSASKTQNAYIFSSVTIRQPGKGQSFDVMISNMKVDASATSILSRLPVMASVTITSATKASITVTGSPQIVAYITYV